LRATGHEVIGLAATAAHVLAGLPMGYNRDTREIKEWSALGFDKTLAALGILRVTLSTLGVDQDRMLAAVRANYSSTTDLADLVAQRNGVGYRQVYAIIGRLVDGLIEAEQPLESLSAEAIVEAARTAGLSIQVTDTEVQEALDPARALHARRHIGGAAPDEMARLLAARQAALETHDAWATVQQDRIAAARAETRARIAGLST